MLSVIAYELPNPEATYSCEIRNVSAGGQVSWFEFGVDAAPPFVLELRRGDKDFLEYKVTSTGSQSTREQGIVVYF